ncbi:MAG: DNA repair protein RecN [Candidatus Marinimicrobia bacterium]|nr:DNA repair protein RecN [Candidatus Neomarinimicrobiota bacterium]MDD5582423.1 DNA repair protein RecN [Candidatus Neomarinimicrobiota bacterium]
MLKYLHVENFAIVREAELTLGPGLTIITGETGTGKSILIDALGLVLGDRAIVSMIRKGSDKAVIEAIFDAPPFTHELENLLAEEDLPIDNSEWTLRRELYQNGKSRTFFNDHFVSLQILKKLSDFLVEMHGQHEHQKILNSNIHSEYLDAYAHDTEFIYAYLHALQELKDAIQAEEILKKNRDQFLKEQELKSFHYEELKKINPRTGELDDLEAELKILENSQELVDLSHRIANTLYESDESVVAKLSSLKHDMAHLLRIDPEPADYLNELESAIISLEEMGRSMAEYRDHIPHDPKRLEAVTDRVNLLNFMTQKYHKSYEELCEYYESLKKTISQSEDFSEALKKASARIEKARIALIETGEQLHEKRKEAAHIFSKNVEDRLHRLGMEHAQFNVHFSYQEGASPLSVSWEGKQIIPQSHGFDILEFQLITNPGEGFLPLRTIASGGEASRIMLAIKSVLSEADSIPTLIFDEADIGISGRIARIVGEHIEELSMYHQVICITHLPQIASLGEQHLVVEKEIIQGRTETRIRYLHKEERVQEIAKLLGAGKITDAALENARDFLQKTQKSQRES